MKIESRVALAPLTTLGVGGDAAHFVRAEHETELAGALAWAKQRALEVRVLGGGSNVVVADAGFSGLVIDMGLRGVRIHNHGADVEVRAAAGEPWDEFVAAMVSRGYQGLECLSGIPGRVGATPIQNVGAYGQEVSETITSVATLDTLKSAPRTFSNEECKFAYRDSWFKSREPGRYIVTEVTFRLRLVAAPSVRYAELERHLHSSGTAAPSLSQLREAVLQLRRAKSMLLDESDPNRRSCGSFFVNPLLDPAQFAGFSARAAGIASVPQFPQPDGRVKLSAGWLIEQSGLPRGTRDGAVGLSTKHALALVAHPGASAADVTRFAARVQRAVLERFGVQLEPEPVFWGESASE
ncbi:MAG TPA: UDP-N-acetylmuramate dehydrogenase [Polyangiaceae bacterium]|nr:UDP-N-acetylmuramate dehydrogenase [Polyangiaceae bacterium]